jgi:[protein-PII] uridylyltransferase
MDAARATTLPLAELAARYAAEQQRIRESFALSADGAACVVARSLLADQTVIGAWNNCFRANCKGVALLAVGGYGRGQLFPFSDVDLLVLVKNAAAEKRFAESARGLSQSLWDMNFRLSISTRTVDECERLSPDNSEFTLALLDARPLCGDPELLTQFMQKSLPAMMQRERNALQRRTAELTRVRHEKYGNTMFHLEPNLKDGPGGMRDVHVCRWLSCIQSAEAATSSPPDLEDAEAFLTSTRCFLHYRAGRDDNTLYWQAQDEAAAQGIGTSTGYERPAMETAAWMRAYFRHARNVQRNVTQLLEEAENASSSIYQQVRRWRTPAKSSDYQVRNGQIISRVPLSAENAALCFDLFRAVAVEGLPLSRAAEESILDLLPFVAMQLPSNEELWVSFQFLLQAPYAGKGFRAMHALGVLELVLPEFHGIDALVIRDAYHRYTVDEHTFVVLDSLHRMARPARQKDDDTRWHDLLKELDRPELLYFAALMHDTGKGRSGQDHTRASAALAESALLRFGADEAARAMVDQLIVQHLEMSAALRRDIFDSETVRAFCQKVGTPEILKMLTLLTYADIQSVHPDALTHWKADAIWQLYIASSNHLDRSLDEERVEGEMDAAHVTRVMLSNQDQGVEILKFLGGLPRRYLRTRSAEELRSHFAMANALQGSSASLMTRPLDDSFEVTVITHDRPYLFSDVAGALAAQGMNIVKADAFANNAGIVVDTFRFSDPYATLRENPTEMEVFESRLKDVVTGTTQVGDLLKARMQARRKRPRKRTLEHSLTFDNASSSHSTLLHVVAEDTPGLLYTLTRALAEHDCDIGVALVDTEGEQAIDVFYLTLGGTKLGAGVQQQIYAVLDAALRHL